jgi:ribonuclease HI
MLRGNAMKEIAVYADGACEGNPGPGGFAAIIEDGGDTREIVGSVPQTTNNRMELMAIIRALVSLSEPARVHIVTDSQYVVRGITQWIHGWKRKRWKTASGHPVKNKDLWLKLLELADEHQVSWEWIRGHSGHPQNERADALAKRAITEMKEKW